MKFAVDRIEGEYAILENIETGEKREELLTFLPIVKEKKFKLFLIKLNIERRVFL